MTSKYANRVGVLTVSFASLRGSWSLEICDLAQELPSSVVASGASLVGSCWIKDVNESTDKEGWATWNAHLRFLCEEPGEPRDILQIPDMPCVTP